MKILQLSNKAPFPSTDGSSIAISNLAFGLSEHDVNIHLLTINTKKHFKPDEEVSAIIKNKIHYQSVYKNTSTSIIGAFLNLFSNQSYFSSRFYFKAFEKVLIKKLNSETFDIIQLEGVFMASYIHIIKKYSRAIISLRTHNIEHQIWERVLLQEKNWLKKKYISLQNNRLKKFELNAFHICDTIITITDIDRKNIEALGFNKKIKTSLTGVDLKMYQPILYPSETNTVFSFASMDWLPNVEAVNWFLQHVWDDVSKEMPNIKLIIAGKGMPLSIQKKASDKIHVIEHVENSTKLYQQYDIMIVPLLSGSGLRIKLVEGLAYGKAIITTSIGAEGIPYEKNKHLIIADSAIDFKNALIELIKNKHLKTELQISARQLAEAEFDYKKVAKELIIFYQSLLES
ncbi:MAG: glycosyltransferase family 4 protein [Bacteroidota bacterium]